MSCVIHDFVGEFVPLEQQGLRMAWPPCGAPHGSTGGNPINRVTRWCIAFNRLEPILRFAQDRFSTCIRRWFLPRGSLWDNHRRASPRRQQFANKVIHRPAYNARPLNTCIPHTLPALCLLPAAFCFLPSASCLLPSPAIYPLVTHGFSSKKTPRRPFSRTPGRWQSVAPNSSRLGGLGP
jgi:hypothetical protein